MKRSGLIALPEELTTMTPSDRSVLAANRGYRGSTRRRFVASVAAVPLALGTGISVSAQATPGASLAASPIASPVGEAGGGYLAVADPVAARLYVYTLPDLAFAGALDGVVAQAHAGFLPMPDGTLAFIDERGSRLVAMGMDGGPRIVGETLVTGTVSHFAIDADHAHYAAVGSDDRESPITLVDLETWSTVPAAIPDTGEVGLMLTHDTLFHRNDVLNRIEAYPIEHLLGGGVEPVATVAIGASGHGESIDATRNRLYTATDDGIDVAEWDGSALTFITTYPWNEDGRTGGRGYFQRLSFDGAHVVSYVSDRSADETAWTTWTNRAMVVDTASGEVLRPEIGDGYVYRFGLADALAVFYRLGGDGDEAVVLDLDTGSDTFGTISRRITLDPMSTGPKPGDPIYEVNQYRAVNVTPDGSLGFVTQGGDGVVSVLDPRTGDIVGSINTPSNLDGGGYLAVFGGPDSFTDTIGR
jgi:hypothetical protein